MYQELKRTQFPAMILIKPNLGSLQSPGSLKYAWKTRSCTCLPDLVCFTGLEIENEQLDWEFKTRRQRRRRCLAKNEFIIYLRMSQLCKSFQYAYQSKTLLRLSMHQQRSIPKEDSGQCFIGISKHREESWKYEAQQSIFDEIQCLGNRWNTDSSVWYIFLIETKTKE